MPVMLLCSCGYDLTNIKSIIKHINTKRHQNGTVKKILKDQANDILDVITNINNKTYRCKRCNYETTDKKAYMSHHISTLHKTSKYLF